MLQAIHAGAWWEYRRHPVENDWHQGWIEPQGADSAGRPLLRWRNAAGVSWTLRPDLRAGRLRCAADDPHFGPQHPHGADSRILPRRDPSGDWRPEIAGFRFLGGTYTREAP